MDEKMEINRVGCSPASPVDTTEKPVLFGYPVGTYRAI